MAQLNQEPSMEDILASIKRIIAEDSEAVGARLPRGRREQVQPANEPEVPKPVAAVPEPEPEPESRPEPVQAAAEPETADVLELTSPIAVEVAPVVTPETPAAAAQAVEAILSDPARTATRTAFAALSQLHVRADPAQPNTLEGLVADLLRPMLREWLDRELPALVERLVAAEIARVTGRS